MRTIVENEDGTRKYVCNVCLNHYKQKDHFTQHYRHVHLDLRPKLRGCHLCPVKVPGRLRAYHMEEAHGVPAPSCGACGKKFPFRWQMLRHQKFYHMGETDYRCELCNLAFLSRSILNMHMKKHRPEKPFKCEICEKSFRWKKNLKTHIMIHTNEKPHVCNVCQEAFVQTTSLKYHIMKRHPSLV